MSDEVWEEAARRFSQALLPLRYMAHWDEVARVARHNRSLRTVLGFREPLPEPVKPDELVMKPMIPGTMPKEPQ